ncbi:agmatinase [Epibacterium sp. SM1969]|uniref:Agmatinase n=1 Tax=Tritonibacter aquimaris TaxID=2663379 RepID=A0A844AS89_9RHOB|nr:agmatinase [Tritonibacter aquimaris]MQY41244.1 agmatinase [Tritonibacter aquimaris]
MTQFNHPISGNDLAHFSGPNTYMRLPQATSLDGLDVAFLGVPLDVGSSWRSGARFGPKEIRSQSAMIRPYNLTTKAAPFDHLNVADIGDLAINTFSLKESLRIVEDSYDAILGGGVVPMAMGGDHSITLPILRAMARKYGPLAVVHIGAHADVGSDMFGETEAHGTVYRRANEEGLLLTGKTYQIGLRGTGDSPQEFAEAVAWGFQHFQASELWGRSLSGMGAEIRRDIGNRPTYISFDINALDPSFAQGASRPEIGGLTSMQALELLRSLTGVNVVGCDLVEVSPAYDPTGTTALTAANLLYEMLCILPGVAQAAK